MKLKVNCEENKVALNVVTTEKEIKTFILPKKNIHYWYPFNVNFHYKYSDAKDYLYLVQDSGYDGENHYRADLLKKTRPLKQRDGVMFHPYVYKRNKYIIERAKSLGIPTINTIFTYSDVEQGFSDLSMVMKVIKDRIEDRLINQDNGEWFTPYQSDEDWDIKVYNLMNEKEKEVLTEIGEIYSMLTVMRKISEGI